MTTPAEELTTTNIRLPKKHLRALKQEALQKDKSVGFIVRDLIRQYVQGNVHENSNLKKCETFFDVLKDIEKQGYKGPEGLASNMDEYLYGGK